ncbi:MAG: PTS sugar transporter subunit IIA [bacterium]|nr:MAG: PTS sugar transporter subunit IIA [bacterium]
MSVAEYIKPEFVALDLKSKTRHEVFETLTSCLSTAGVLDKPGADLLVQKLEDREKMATTGVGEGIAIPHSSIDGISNTAIAVGVIPGGVDFASVDSRPVNVVFMIIGSKSVPRLHIQLLAKIVRLCRNGRVMKKVREGKTSGEVLEAIRMEDV